MKIKKKLDTSVTMPLISKFRNYPLPVPSLSSSHHHVIKTFFSFVFNLGGGEVSNTLGMNLNFNLTCYLVHGGLPYMNRVTIFQIITYHDWQKATNSAYIFYYPTTISTRTAYLHHVDNLCHKCNTHYCRCGFVYEHQWISDSEPSASLSFQTTLLLDC